MVNRPIELRPALPNQVIEVDLICDQRYHVDKVSLTDPDGDITESHTTRNVTFTDNDADKSYSVYYSITILDTSANTTFGCDPTIHNEDEEPTTMPDSNALPHRIGDFTIREAKEHMAAAGIPMRLS